MTSSDVPRRVWPSVAALVALALVVPATGALLDDDADTAHSGAHRLTSAVTRDVPEPDPMAPQRVDKGSTRALFFGDSYFIGGGYTTEDNSMARLASNRLGWTSEINGGGGTGFVQANPEYDLPNYLGQIEDGAFDVGRRRWVVIEGGGNDEGHPLRLVNANARKVLRIARRTFPRARLVLMGPMDADPDHSDVTPVHRALRRAARKRDVPYIDARRWLEGHYDLVGPDYVHPYPEGHRLCARKLTRALRALGA
jgi:lysophospholipase L1-like esterase